MGSFSLQLKARSDEEVAGRWFTWAKGTKKRASPSVGWLGGLLDYRNLADDRVFGTVDVIVAQLMSVDESLVENRRSSVTWDDNPNCLLPGLLDRPAELKPQ